MVCVHVESVLQEQQGTDDHGRCFMHMATLFMQRRDQGMGLYLRVVLYVQTRTLYSTSRL